MLIRLERRLYQGVITWRRLAEAPSKTIARGEVLPVVARKVLVSNDVQDGGVYGVQGH